MRERDKGSGGSSITGVDYRVPVMSNCRCKEDATDIRIIEGEIKEKEIALNGGTSKDNISSTINHHQATPMQNWENCGVRVASRSLWIA